MYHMYGWEYWCETNLAVGKINHVSLNFIPLTFNTCIETLGAYTFIEVRLH